jgi:hypothetical protein
LVAAAVQVLLEQQTQAAVVAVMLVWDQAQAVVQVL